MSVPGVASPASPSERRIATIGALLVGLGPISLALFTPAMPEIATALKTSVSIVQLSITVYFAGFACAQLVAGPLSDAFGRRRVLLVFLTFYLAGSIASLLSPDVATLLAGRLVQGIGAAAGVSVARAIVRDLFTSDRSARIMNLMSLMLSVGPSIAPAIGGVTMEFFGWHAIFLLMIVQGVIIMLLVLFALPETAAPDPARARPRKVLQAYSIVLANRRFVWSSLTIAGTVGTFYTQSAVLSVVIIGRMHHSGSDFGLMMLAITGSYFCGAIAVGRLIPKFGAFALVPFGLAILMASGLSLTALLLAFPLGTFRLLLPIMAFTFGNAFVLPAMYTASLEAFSENAGAASAMNGFLQMSTGLAGTFAASLFADPVMPLVVFTPVLGLMACCCWYRWRHICRVK